MKNLASHSKAILVALCIHFASSIVPSTAVAQPASLAQCEQVKGPKKRSECFENLARTMSERKKSDDEITGFVSRAKLEAARNLVDPESANFRELLVTKDKTGQTLCGQMNAKNRAGGYVGYGRFLISFNDSRNSFGAPSIEGSIAPATEIDRIKVDLFESSWKLHCIDFQVIWKAPS